MRLGINADFPAAMLRELQQRANATLRIDEAIESAAKKLRDRAVNHSQGRPGPNVITGQFRDAWTYAHGADAAEVANGSVYAARLEFGFVGVDSLGRHYNQPPYPSLQPAVSESEDLLPDELRRVLF